MVECLAYPCAFSAVFSPHKYTFHWFIGIKLIDKKGVINIGGPRQTIYNFAKKDNKVLKKIYSKGEFPLNQDMNLKKMKKLLKK